MADTDWHCPYCGKEMTEDEGGMRCETHGLWTWAALGATDPEAGQ